MSMNPESSSRTAALAQLAARNPGLSTLLQLIKALESSETRERSLLLLSKSPEIRGELAPLLWHTSGVIAIFLQEIISVYPKLNPATLTGREANRVCNVIALLQGIASHPETKSKFLKANIPAYLYPFLNNTSKEKPHEFLRLTSLGVIGALVKVEDHDAIHFLLESQILPCCLRSMEIGEELSKTVATFIVYKILNAEEGLNYCCCLAERFFAIGRVLQRMLDNFCENLAENPSKRLLKHILWCYRRLSENYRACEGFKLCLPRVLTDSTIINIMQDDEPTLQCLQQLFDNITKGPKLEVLPIEQLFRHLMLRKLE